MPVRRNRTRRPRTVKRRIPRTIPFKANVNVGKGFPKKMTMTHKFFHTAILANDTGTPSTIANESFFVNGLFQPVMSGVTHQPLYFDQMQAIYNRYVVIGSKIRVKFINNGAINNGAFAVGFMNDKTAAIAPTLMSTMIEQTGGKYLAIHSGGSDGGANSTKTLNYSWSAKKRFGGSILSNNDIGSFTSAGNPVLTPLYTIAMQDMAATTAEQLTYSVEITYIAVWSGLKDIAGS